MIARSSSANVLEYCLDTGRSKTCFTDALDQADVDISGVKLTDYVAVCSPSMLVVVLKFKNSPCRGRSYMSASVQNAEL